MRKRIALLLALVAAPLAAASATGAAPETGPAYTDWNPAYIGFASNTERDRRKDCPHGSDRCIDRTIGEMWRRFHRYVPPCDHNAVFSMTYLRVTQDIRGGVDDGFYTDPKWLNHLDAVFARMYFDGYRNWRKGRLELVPPAWRIAFGTAGRSEVRGIGNLLLSMNAHVQRDFPFALYHAGLVYPDGSSRKPEHDAGNVRLRAMYTPMLEELSHRFDASIDDHDIPGLIADDEMFFDLLVQWRETAWDYAVELAEAANGAERRAIAAEIERNAVDWANMIYAGSVYGPNQTSAPRDARCLRFGGQDPSWARGADVARPGRRGRIENGRLFVPLRCPDGPGPCWGEVRVEGFGVSSDGRGGLAEPTGFAVRAGTGKLLALGNAGPLAPGDVIEIAVKSRLGPGDAVTVRRDLRIAPR